MVTLKHKTKDKTLQLQEQRYNYLLELGTDFSQYDEVKPKDKREKELTKIFKEPVEIVETSEQTNDILLIKSKKQKENDL